MAFLPPSRVITSLLPIGLKFVYTPPAALVSESLKGTITLVEVSLTLPVGSSPAATATSATPAPTAFTTPLLWSTSSTEVSLFFPFTDTDQLSIEPL